MDASRSANRGHSAQRRSLRLPWLARAMRPFARALAWPDGTLAAFETLDPEHLKKLANAFLAKRRNAS
jgi:hypothetical protein